MSTPETKYGPTPLRYRTDVRLVNTHYYAMNWYHRALKDPSLGDPQFYLDAARIYWKEIERRGYERNIP